jgi:type VI secretion system protein ImpA
MLTQVDEHRLEEWESGEMVARALGLLYRAIEILGDDEGNMQDLYLRICRLDPMQAITFGLKASGSE